MSEIRKPSTAKNSSKRSANKSTISEAEAKYLKVFKWRMTKACEFHVENNRRYNLKLPLLSAEEKGLEEILKSVDAVHNLIRNAKTSRIGLNYKIFHQENLSKLRTYISDELARTRKAIPVAKIGRPSLKGDLIMLIFSALHRGKGNRAFLDDIGTFIQQGGVLQKIIDKRFGPTSFDDLNLPTVTWDEVSWEKGCKPGLEKKARKGLGRYKHMSDKQHEDRFLKELSRGGRTDYECYVEAMEEERRKAEVDSE